MSLHCVPILQLGVIASEVLTLHSKPSDLCDTFYPNMHINKKTYKARNLIKSILFNKIISKSTWVKDSHSFHCCQIKLLRNSFAQNNDVQVYKITVKQQNKIK